MSDIEPISSEELEAIEGYYHDMLYKFFDVRQNDFVTVDDGDITKFAFALVSGEVRYGLRATLPDGRHAHKFIPESDWRFVDAPFVEAVE